MQNTDLPLIDIHRHLDGNIRPQTIWQLAQQNNIALPEKTLASFIPHVQIQDSEADLMAFLRKLDWGVAVLKSLDDCKRIAYENVEDAYNAGLNYAELRFSPYYMAKTHQLSPNEVVAAVIDGINQGMQAFNIKIKLIGILSRTFGVQACDIELEALLAHKDHIVAIDLAGDELTYPAPLFVEHFKKAKDAGLHITIHAGEAAGAESVWQAIQLLHAERIGHGVASVQDPKLMDYLVEHNITIESCLTSNFQTGTVKDISEHPIKQFLAHGIQVCLNTDDPAVQGIEIKNEYKIAREVLKFSEKEINQLKQNALNASFLSPSEKKHLINQKNYNN